MNKQRKMSVAAIFILCVVILTIDSTFTVAKQSTEELKILKIGTMELPPYGWKDAQGEKHGIIYELNQEIENRLNFTLQQDVILIEGGEN